MGDVGTAYGHVLVLDLGLQLVLQAVNVDENAIDFFLVRLWLLETGFAFLFLFFVFISY